jgi:hypothetical protein
MATSNPHDEDDRPQSRWGADFWSKYRKLSSLIASRPDGYPARQLVPAPQASAQIRNTEKLLSHVTALLEAKRDVTGDNWTKSVSYVADVQVNSDNGELSLEDIASWTPEQTTIERSKPGRAAGTKQVAVRGYLPPTAATELFRQFQEILDHLGWAEHAAIKDYTAGEDEVLRHP